MKSPGSVVQFTRCRNLEILRLYRKLIAQSKVVSMSDIIRTIADSPSSRFWVSEERAAIVISALIKGRPLPSMTRTKRRMYLEIYRRYRLLRPKCPGLTTLEIVSAIVNQPAPSFYLTPRTVGEFIYRMKKNRNGSKS